MGIKKKASGASIAFSRTLGLFDGIALGAGISIGFTLPVLVFPILKYAGASAIWVYLLAAILYLPVILSYAESFRDPLSGANPYEAARNNDRVFGAFVVGWLSLLGLLSLGATFLHATMLRLKPLIGLFSADGVADVPLSLAVLAAAVLYILFTAGEQWRARRVAMLTAIVVSFLVMFWAFFMESPSDAKALEITKAAHSLTAVAMLAGGLWYIFPILTHRQHFRKPDRLVPFALIGVWGISQLLGFLAALVLITFPHLIMDNWMEKIGGIELRVELVALIGAILLLWSGVIQTLILLRSVVIQMRKDGFFPAFKKEDPVSYSARESIIYTVVIALIIFALSIIAPATFLAGLASITFLWITVITLARFARKKKEKKGENKGFTLPLHPLFPTFGAALSLFLSMILSAFALKIVCAYLFIGFLYFLLYARRARITTRQEEVVVGERREHREKASYRVLVSTSKDSIPSSLIKLGAKLAQSKNGELLVLRVVSSFDQTGAQSVHQEAQNTWEELGDNLTKTLGSEVEFKALVRVAPDIASGILATAAEYQASLLLLPETRTGDLSINPESREVLERVFVESSRPVAIVKGDFHEGIDRIALCAGSGDNTPISADIALSLAEANKGELTVLRGYSNIKAREENEKLIEQTLDEKAPACSVRKKSFYAERLVNGLLDESEGYELLVMGAARDPFLGGSKFEGLPFEIVRDRQKATIIAKGSEHAPTYFVRRIAQALAKPFPTLSPHERAEVFKEMRSASRADIDFYTLMSLSSFIAVLGLLLDSAAVIIGAMLVAPLMSPILAIGQGIVRGNHYMIRQGVSSTLKGIGIAIGVSALVALLNPIVQPTDEILARSEPHVLDLLVALAAGAAAAYALSRKSVSAALPGVAIAVALVPPLCVVGYGIGSSHFLIAGGALLLFLTNLASIVLVGALVFLLFGFRPAEAGRGLHFKRGMSLAILFVVILGVPLGITTVRIIQKDIVTRKIQQLLWEETGGRIDLEELRVKREGGEYVADVIIYAYQNITHNSYSSIVENIYKKVGVPVRIRAKVITTNFYDRKPGAGHVDGSYATYELTEPEE